MSELKESDSIGLSENSGDGLSGSSSNSGCVSKESLENRDNGLTEIFENLQDNSTASFGNSSLVFAVFKTKSESEH